jgi:hypothetical protein
MALSATALLIVAPLSEASDSGQPDPIAVELVGSERTEFTDDVAIDIRLQPEGRSEQTLKLENPSRVAVARITIQPGAVFPWHTHPEPVFAGVDEGELIYTYADDCIGRPYPKGTMFVDPGGDNVHTAHNPSTDEEAVVTATFLNAPEQGKLTLPVDKQSGQQLDEKCDINR